MSDGRKRAVRVHAQGDSADVDLSVPAGQARHVSRRIKTSCVQLPAFLVGDFRSFVPMVEIVLSVRADRYRVEAVVVVFPVEPGEQDLALVHPLVKYGIPVDVRVDDQVGRLGYDDPVVDHQSRGGDEFLFLNEDMELSATPSPSLSLDHDDPVTVGLGPSSPVVASLRNPDASL